MAKATILMAVHNGMPFLKHAVHSILIQTFRDFCFLIIDDASTDGSWEWLQRVTDPRVNCERNESNLGLAASLNRGLDLCHTDYILRMDGDDLCDRRRIQWQIDFMEAHPRLGMSGTWLKTFGVFRERERMRYAPDMSQIRANMLFGSPVAHATLIFRRASLESCQLRYDPSYTRTEDFDLCVRAAEHMEIGNLCRYTYFYRRHAACVTTHGKDDMVKQIRTIVRRQIESVGLKPDEHDLDLHCRAASGSRLENLHDVDDVDAWFSRLFAAGMASGKYEEVSLRRAIGRAWFLLCKNSTTLGPGMISRYRHSVHADGWTPGFQDSMKFFASTLWHAMRGE